MNSMLSNLYAFFFSQMLLFFVLLFTPNCWALVDNLNKDPISIQSNTLELDQQHGLAIYIGNVLLKQNDKELSADKIVIYKNAQGKLEKILAYGNPAKYQGILKNEPVFGEANKITFLPNAQDMILEGQAKLLQKQDKFTAPYISYNFQSKRIRSKAEKGVQPTIVFHPN